MQRKASGGKICGVRNWLIYRRSTNLKPIIFDKYIAV